MAGVGPMRADGIEFLQNSALRVGDPVGGYGAGGGAFIVVGFVNRVEEFSVGMQGKEGRAGGFGCKSESGEGSGCVIKAAGIDTLALISGLGAQKDRAFHGCSKEKVPGFCKREASCGELERCPSIVGAALLVAPGTALAFGAPASVGRLLFHFFNLA